jgi:hypothetical protein
MSLRGAFGGKAGSENGDSTVIRRNSGPTTSLLNTPLGNTMKKLGMNPSGGGSNLNEFLVRKGNSSN